MNACSPGLGLVALIAGALSVLVVAARAVPAGSGKAAEAPELLIVTDEREPMKALAGFLEGTPGYKVTSVEPGKLPPGLSKYAGVFMYVHGRLTDAAAEAMIGYAEGGGRLVVLHHGIASGKVRTPKWMAFTGMHIAPRNDPNHPWEVLGNTTHTLVNLQPGHYVTSHNVRYDRLVEYRSSDSPSRAAKLPALDLPSTEVFLNQQFTDGRAKTVLFGFRAERAGKPAIMQDRSGWYKPAGKGWLFYLQPGHAAPDFQNEAFCQIIWNCLSWRPDVKPAGWPVQVAPRPAQPPAGESAPPRS